MMKQAIAAQAENPSPPGPMTVIEGGRNGPSAAMKVGALIMPFVLLALVEMVFRLTGIGAPAGKDADRWANPLVAYDESLALFPEWDTEIAMPKPDDVTRVFVLGGSTAAGFGVDTPFSQTLERALNEKTSAGRVEVINGGVGAAGSHRVYEALRRASAFSPDLFVVYMGHNEFLEDIFFDPDGLLSRIEETGRAARQIHVVNVLRGLTGAPEKAKLTGEKTILKSRFLGTMNFPLIKSAEQVNQKMLFLKGNMMQMVAFAREHDVKIAFVPAEPSLLTGPSWPEYGPGFDKDPGTFADAMRDAKAALRERRFADAEPFLKKALTVDDQFATTHYLLGLALLGQKKTDEGVASLRQAVRHDWNGDRASSLTESTILETAKLAGVPSLSLSKRFDSEMQADFERMVEAGGLEDFLAVRKPGHTLFLDHCHPSERGHEIVGNEIATWLVGDAIIGEGSK